MNPENTVRLQRGRPFPPGQSGNPSGRPQGARNRSTIAAESLLEGEAERLTRKAVELALPGDTMALRLCLERLVPPRKDRPIQFELPAVANDGDVSKAMGAVLAALAAGEITPSEATVVAGLIEASRRVLALEPSPASAQPVLRVHFVAPSGAAGDSRSELSERGTDRD